MSLLELIPVDYIFYIKVLILIFLAILFSQSGLDKVFDWKGNLSWLTGHFSNSLLAGFVPVLLFVITVFEILAGLFSAVGIFVLTFSGETWVGFIGVLLSSLSLTMLFFGQRMAKDYAGAGGLVHYFILTILGLYFLGN
jgi:uncharacterized membrane protein YphA (DoxX/SURF4 family)